MACCLMCRCGCDISSLHQDAVLVELAGALIMPSAQRLSDSPGGLGPPRAPALNAAGNEMPVEAV